MSMRMSGGNSTSTASTNFMKNSKQPKTPSEWRRAVNLAEICLAIDDARELGLLKIEPCVQVVRCATLLREGKQLGYVPQAECTEQFIHGLARNFTKTI